jgi:hypothetical protein
MRTITQEQHELIEDLSAQGLLRNLPVQTAEKDIHVTDLLERLTSLKVEHAHFKGLQRRELREDTGIKLIFAGGTCLSKAYGIIERMSEDIDIKVVLDFPEGQELKVGDRGRLKALHASVLAELRNLSLHLTPSAERNNPEYRDVHRHFIAEVNYASHYHRLASLRPALQLEIIHRPPILATNRRRIGYLHESLGGLSATQDIEIECISIAETLAEKVLSLLRRSAWKWSGHQDGEMDPALTRHIYDVHRILAVDAHALQQAQTIFRELVEGELHKFSGQNPDFDANPKWAMKQALDRIESNQDLKDLFEGKVVPLVYGVPVTYQEGCASFRMAADTLLAQL